LVLLLAGPATNPATMAVVRRFLGSRVLIIYVASIAGSAVCAGWLVDVLYRALALTPTTAVGEHHAEGAWVSQVGGAVLLLLMARSYLRRIRR
jgi:hypothetical protein